MRFALLALPFALIGAAAAAAVRSENNLVESSLQGRQSCLARGQICDPFEDLCCAGCQDSFLPCDVGTLCFPEQVWACL
ncbi:hypothetical protein B0H14DRAFT_3749028 [Mycena olivaceomarginata]|nr:hypothetical protein B0H14DRAFT_3749028 [Mycena olivaceomarginata]